MSAQPRAAGRPSAGEIVWDGRERLLQIVGVHHGRLFAVELAGPTSQRDAPQQIELDDIEVRGMRRVNFQAAMTMREMIEASRSRPTTRQRDFLLARFALPDTPVMHPPQVPVAHAERSVAEGLIERGILIAAPIAASAELQVRLTTLRGLPLVRRLRGENALLDVGSVG